MHLRTILPARIVSIARAISSFDTIYIPAYSIREQSILNKSFPIKKIMRNKYPNLLRISALTLSSSHYF